MDNDMIRKVLELLSNHETLEKITDVANNISADAPAREAEQVTPTHTLPTVRAIPEQDPQGALLCALKPFMRQERREKIDALVKALSVVSLISTMRTDKKQDQHRKGAIDV